MHFVRSVDREDLYNAFLTGYKDNCFVDCTKAHDQFKPFGTTLVSVRNQNKIHMTFYADKVDLEIEGPNALKKTFSGVELTKNLLAIFIGEKNPPTKELRSGLLGLIP